MAVFVGHLLAADQTGLQQPRDEGARAHEGVNDVDAFAAQGLAKLGGLTPRAIRTHLGLNKPIYRKTAAYGHFGRKPEGDYFPWERTDLVNDLKAALE